MIAPEQCAILTTLLTGYLLMSAFRCLLSFMTPVLIRLKVLVSYYLTQMYNNHSLKHRFLYKEAFMQVHRAQHCIALRIIAHITGTQTLNSLQSPALWRIFEAVLGILFKASICKRLSVNCCYNAADLHNNRDQQICNSATYELVYLSYCHSQQ